jgi:hypothetical protein
VVADITVEIAAVEQVERGDLSGRAAQATTWTAVEDWDSGVWVVVDAG